jgi:hypothetical protein
LAAAERDPYRLDGDPAGALRPGFRHRIDSMFFHFPPRKHRMTEKLDPEAKRLRNISPGDAADAIGALEALKAEAIRREIHRAEGENYRIVPTPPGTQQRTDKPLLLRGSGSPRSPASANRCTPVGRSPAWR